MISKAGAEMKARARARRVATGRQGMAKARTNAYNKVKARSTASTPRRIYSGGKKTSLGKSISNLYSRGIGAVKRLGGMLKRY